MLKDSASHVQLLGRLLDGVGHEAAAEAGHARGVAAALGGRGQRLTHAADHVGGRAGATRDWQTA